MIAVMATMHGVSWGAVVGLVVQLGILAHRVRELILIDIDWLGSGGHSDGGAVGGRRPEPTAEEGRRRRRRRARMMMTTKIATRTTRSTRMRCRCANPGAQGGGSIASDSPCTPA